MTSPSGDPTLRTALEAFLRNYTPLPIRPASKVPIGTDWEQTAYATTADIKARFTDAGAAHPDKRLNLGLALGAPSGGLIDVDLDHHKALRIAAEVLPYTAMRTGRAGRPSSHHWYVVDGFDPGTRQFKLPNGQVVIEWRGTGGQTVIPPSLHPEGDTYAWYGDPWGGEEGPTRLTADEGKGLLASVMSIALAVTLADGWPLKGSRHSAYLALVGGLLRSADEDGRPALHPLWDHNVEGIVRLVVALTNDADGPSSRVAESVPSTRKKILRGAKAHGWPTLIELIGERHAQKARDLVEEIEALAGVPRLRPTMTREEIAAESEIAVSPSSPSLWDGADAPPTTTAERDVLVATTPDEKRDPLLERLNEWERVDLGPYLRMGYEPPEPTYLYRDDGHGMIYPGRVNMLYGEGGSGKTFIALDMAKRVMEGGERVVMIDLEDEPVNTIKRLQELGLSNALIDSDKFTYIHPERSPLASMEVDRWGDAKASTRGAESAEALRAALDRVNPDLIIVDGMTTLYRIHGLDTNTVTGADVVGGWMRDLTNSYTRTVVMIDHTGKGAGPAAGPIGSQHKIAMVQGIALRVAASTRPRRGITGEAALIVGKDRLGRVLEQATHSDPPVVANVKFVSDEEGRMKVLYETPSAFDSAAATFVNNQGGRPPKVTENAIDKLLDALRLHGGSLTRQEVFLAAGLGDRDDFKETSQLKALNTLAERGLIVKHGKGRSTRWKIQDA